MSFESIHELAKEYFKERKKHIEDNWLKPKNAFKRLWNPYSGVLNILWEYDVKASKEALDKLRSKLALTQVTKDDLKDYLIHLNTHNFRVSDRNHYLILFPTFAAALVVLADIGGPGKAFAIIPAVLGVFIITERSALQTQKVVNDELIGLLQREIERMP